MKQAEFLQVQLFCYLSLIIVGHTANAEIITTQENISLNANGQAIEEMNVEINNIDVVHKPAAHQDSLESKIVEVKPAAIALNKEIAGLLKRFQDKPDDLSVIKQLNVDGDRVVEYVAERIKHTMERPEFLMLLEALSLTNNQKATEYLVSLGTQFHDDADLTINLLSKLQEMPLTESVNGYFDLLMKENRDNVFLLRTTLLAMAIAEVPEVKRWATLYRSPGIDQEIRFIGLYLASTLGKDETLQRWILEILLDENKPPAYQHYYLLVALSRQMSDEHFYDFLSRSYIAEKVIDSVKLERQFYQGNTELRLQLASKLINSSYADQRNTAISFLLKEQGFEKTWQQLNQQQHLSAIRLSYKLGIPLVSESNDEPIKDNYFWYVLIFSIIGLLVFIGFKRERVGKG